MKRIPVSLGCALVAILLSACSGGSSKGSSGSTSTSVPPTTVTEATTTGAPPTTSPAPTTVPPSQKTVTGRNGVTEVYSSASTGTITPKITKTSQTMMPGDDGGTLFRMTDASGHVVYGSATAAVFPELRPRPGWTLTKLSDDPTWNPENCAAAPTAVIGDRWIVTAEGAEGNVPNNPTNGAQYTAYYVRVYDRQTNSYSAVTPITADRPDFWQGAIWKVSDTKVAVVGVNWYGWKNGQAQFEEQTIRTIDLATYAFSDEPYNSTKVSDNRFLDSPLTKNPFDTLFLPPSNPQINNRSVWLRPGTA